MNTNRTFENGFPRSRKGLQKGRKSKLSTFLGSKYN